MNKNYSISNSVYRSFSSEDEAEIGSSLGWMSCDVNSKTTWDVVGLLRITLLG